MSNKQLFEVQAQLPEGTRITKVYRAFEGDIRVIVLHPGDVLETRYTVTFEGDYPRIHLMP